MKSNWHETIQRYLDGQASAEEAAALHGSLNADAELRALYLDYMNLDAALGAAAAAEVLARNEFERTVSFPRPAARLLAHHWRWLAATAGGAALVLLATLSRHPNPSQARPDVAAIIASTRGAIARLSLDPASSFPSWMSPTTSLLAPPSLPQ
jgi:anti-sigma factor RsiW